MLLWLLWACSSDAPAALSFANVGSARIEEVLPCGAHTLLRVQEVGLEFWAAIPSASGAGAAVGRFALLGQGPLAARVTCAGRMLEQVVVVDTARVVDEAEASAHGRLSPPEGGISHAELRSRRQELSGQRVQVRGRVVKANHGTLGTNWYHLVDGSMQEGDLTVTSDSVVEVGQVVTADAPLTIDRDLGFGYFYEVILEGASLTVDGATTPPTTPAPTPQGSAEATKEPATKEPAAQAAAQPAAQPTTEAPAGSAPPEVAQAAPGPDTPPLPSAPTRTWLGLTLGTTDAEALRSWVQNKAIPCVESPALRRLTTHTTCRGPLDPGILADRPLTGGQLHSVLIARTDAGPVHHISTVRRHAQPAEAAADYSAAVAALGARLGTPSKAQPVTELTAFERPIARFATTWRFGDLEVRVSVLKAAGDHIQVNEVWSIPGIEEQVAQRGEGSLHGRKSRPPTNPHILPDQTHPGW